VCDSVSDTFALLVAFVVTLSFLYTVVVMKNGKQKIKQ